MVTRAVVLLLLVPAFIFLAVEKGGNTMVMLKSQADINTGIPPVDANVPARTETATFALG
jgi:hypothetical protein